VTAAAKTNNLAKHARTKPTSPATTACLAISTTQLLQANDEAERLGLNRQLNVPCWLPRAYWPIQFHFPHVNHQGTRSERIVFNLPSKPAKTVADVVE